MSKPPQRESRTCCWKLISFRAKCNASDFGIGTQATRKRGPIVFDTQPVVGPINQKVIRSVNAQVWGWKSRVPSKMVGSPHTGCPVNLKRRDNVSAYASSQRWLTMCAFWPAQNLGFGDEIAFSSFLVVRLHLLAPSSATRENKTIAFEGLHI